MSLALTLPVRPFGIPVKIHILFFVVTLGLFTRQYFEPTNAVGAGELFAFTVLLLFGIILIHEYGHIFAARWVGGEPQEILLWPLGGLAYADVPHHWRPHTLFAAGGPAANVLMCLVFGIVLAAGGYLPNANPLSNPYAMELKNYRDGRVHSSQYRIQAYQPGSTVPAEFTEASAKAINEAAKKGDFAEVDKLVAAAGFERAVAPPWAVWFGRAFWLSWVLLLLNMIPAYPLDGGQIMQGLIWARSGFRQGIVVAAYCGYVAAVLFLIASITANEVLLMGLAAFMGFASYTRLQAVDADDGGFGYDFSAGYTSLERDEPPPPRAKQQSFLKRWMTARAARRLQREAEQQQQEDARFDQLLEKVHKFGKASLTDEERRFMERVSARYRNRS